MAKRTDDEIRADIEAQKLLIVNDIFKDGEVRERIYNLKKELNPRIELHPEEDEDDDCEACGS
jgi:hypoxanthine-guanine phosphoribosyltransferase